MVKRKGTRRGFVEDIIKKIKDHPQFIFADSDDELISIIDEVNPGLTRDQKFDIIDDLEKLGRSGSRKGTRRGFAGDVVAERDESFVVEDTDSDHTIETESTVITDDHEVVTSTEVGSEEDFVAESEEGDADTIDEDGRQGRRKGRRRGSRRGGDAEDHVEDLEEELEDVEEEIEDVEESEDEEREGRRKGRRRGSRRGESVIMDEDGTTEEVDLPEPDEREGRRKGSRMGAYGGKSPEHQSSIKAAVSVAMSDRRL